MLVRSSHNLFVHLFRGMLGLDVGAFCRVFYLILAGVKFACVVFRSGGDVHSDGSASGSQRLPSSWVTPDTALVSVAVYIPQQHCVVNMIAL